MDDVANNRLPHRDLLIVFLLALALTLVLQWRNNAFKAEWSDSSDESAHYVTGLMVRDYIAHGLWENPMTYAERYYQHYPYIGLGHFPPFFYVVQAAWTLPFGVSRGSLLLLVAVTSAALLTTMYAIGRRYFPAWLCWGLLVLLATLPAVQLASRMLMSDLLLALLIFWSVMLLERYLDSPGTLRALAFGIIAVISLLTKATGIVLAPIPVLAALVKSPRAQLSRSSFWLPAALVILLCGPWFLFIPGALHERVARFGGIHFLPYRLIESVSYFRIHFSWVGLSLVLLGGSVVYRRKDKHAGENRLFWLLAGFLLVSTFAFRMIVGAWDWRHLITVFPFLVLFAGAALWWIAGTVLQNHWSGIVLVLSVIAVMSTFNIARTQPKKYIGLDQVAQDLVTNPLFAKSPLLILSDARGEGIFVAEVAMNERRLGHIVERGSKLFAIDNLLGDQYQPTYKDPESVMAFLGQEPSRIIILDTPPIVVPHVQLVRETVAANKARWNTVARYKRSDSKDETSEIQVLKLAP